ncbi:hypothetical protein [Dyadobacter frigoris]|uniref:hypothetical protein n=1 Tax=Dyadobacter frigoris TaxID=2576211 RepID=UPI001C7004B3|nr:hypothetical protein [Dyadobacter frigoris]
MTLFYPENENKNGKTSGSEDRFTSRFIKPGPPHHTIEAIKFETDQKYSGRNQT